MMPTTRREKVLLSSCSSSQCVTLQGRQRQIFQCLSAEGLHRWQLFARTRAIQQNAKYRDSSRSVMTRKKMRPTSAASATINNRNRAKHKYYVPC